MDRDFSPLPTSPTTNNNQYGQQQYSNSNHQDRNRRNNQQQPGLIHSNSSPLNPTRPPNLSFNSSNSSNEEQQQTSLEREGNSYSNTSTRSGGNSFNSNNNNSNNNTTTTSGSNHKNNRNSYMSTRKESGKRESSTQLDSASYAVLAGQVGGDYGPFPRSSTYSNYGIGQAPFSQRDSMASSDVAINLLAGDQHQQSLPYNNRYSTASYSDNSLNPINNNNNHSHLGSGSNAYSPPLEGGLGSHHNSALLWDKENAEADDYLHDPDPELDRMLDRQWSSFSLRGWLNVGILVVLIVTLVGLFAGWPIYKYVITGGFPGDGTAPKLGWNIGGINASGQVPFIPGLPTLIDIATPQSAYKRTGFDGQVYNLVFSDEFNTEGRTFWPGDDPFWEAADLHYWATTDLEWYDPDAVTTKDGYLVITMTEEPVHNLAFRSGMLQSWNKFCFTGGYIEVSMSMPGTPLVQGYWPAAWTQGNLARAGYGATNDGMWPYSYNTCDVGTLPNQTWPNGTWPTAAKTSGSNDYGGELSYLPGQRASACTCPGEDHPGPNVGVGRGAPEIDINEAQVDYRGTGSASQSIQMAPMDAGYNWGNETPSTIMYDTTKTFQNTWHGSINQESMSVITLTDTTSFEGKGFTTFGYEYTPGPAGHITWAMNETATWKLDHTAIGPNVAAGIGQRLVSEEPMYINLNLAISEKFQPPQWGQMVFPGKLRIDYVRVFQTGTPNVGCDPASHPTAAYIARHMEVYTNANETTWMGVKGNTMPKNRLTTAGCS